MKYTQDVSVLETMVKNVVAQDSRVDNIKVRNLKNGDTVATLKNEWGDKVVIRHVAPKTDYQDDLYKVAVTSSESSITVRGETGSISGALEGAMAGLDNVDYCKREIIEAMEPYLDIKTRVRKDDE